MTTFEEFCRQADAKQAAKKKKAKPAKSNGNAKPETAPPPPPSIEELEAAAGELISDPDVLARLGATWRRPDLSERRTTRRSSTSP